MKRHLVLLLLTMLALALPAQTASSPYYFRTYDSDNGLSNNSVNVVIQDRNGLMYFGTKDGLNLYNGISSRTFRKENSALGNNFINALFEDEAGRVWIGTDGGAFIYDPTTDSFVPFHLTKEKNADALTHSVPYICQSPNGNILVACNEQGLYAYTPKTRALKRLRLHHGSRPLLANVSQVWFETRTRGTRMWLALYEDNLYYTDLDGDGACHPFRASDGSEPFRGLEINCQLEGSHNCSYIGTNHGLYEINLGTNIVTRLLSEYVRACTMSDTGEMWVGTEKGIFILRPTHGAAGTSQSGGSMTVQQHITSSHLADEFSLSDNAIYAIYRDRENGMWIGTYFGGVNYYNSQNSIFHKVYPNEATPLFGKRVRELLAEGDDGIWVGTEDRGLFFYNHTTGSIRPFTHPDLYPNIHGLCKIDDELWVGTFSGGLCRINTRTLSLRHYPQGNGSGQLAARSVFCICHTTADETLLGTIGGIYRYHASDDSFELLKDLYGNFVYDILEDHQGNLWFATYNNGVFCRHVKTGRYEHFLPKENDPNSLSYSKVIGLYEDSRHNIWMATQGGGCCSYNLRSHQFTRYGTKEGLPSNVVLSIVEDARGHIWLTTNQGLVSLDPGTGDLRYFSKANGLLSNQFNYRSGLVDHQGNIYLGTTNGLVAFNPQEFRPSSATPTLVVSDLYILGTRATVGKKDSPIQQSILFCDKVNLRANQNTFSLRASVMSYQSPEKNQILYRLDGVDNDWRTLSGTDLIQYTEVHYGTYKLHIKGRDCNGQETEERIIRIHIHPPFYLTIWAYLLYIFIVAGLGFSAYRYTHGRTLRRHQEAMEKLRREKERELYDAKIEFFTNVAHEIRTPLTLIKNPLENVLASPLLRTGDGAEVAAMRDDLETMTMNTDRLLGLVNELLDFRKTESKGFQMHFHRSDVAQLVRKTHTRFAPLARYRSMQFDCDCPDTLMADLDVEGFTKILSNLFNNAIKYAATYVHITLEQQAGEVVVCVQNDGAIVPIGKREEIFQSFARYNDGQAARPIGSGIGLTLARSLAELHGGTLAMDDDLSVNRFILRIPMTHEATDTAPTLSGKAGETAQPPVEQPEPLPFDSSTPDVGQPQHTLLVVEDNLEMQAFIRRQLVQHYHVITADNGQQALELLESEAVHLVVSDVMMPIMDGMELCNRIKNDLNYSHIPVILLTARIGMQASIQGIQQGADAYIEKPFSTDYLLAIIQNLLHSREQLRNAFRNSPATPAASVSISKTDEDFLQRLHAVTIAGMKNSDYSVDQMAADMAMSRSSLNRKIRAVLDLSTGDYIRIERLKYAAELISSGQYKINEVCYMTGFNTPSYFAKCFQKQFGVLPNEYGKK